MIPIRRIFPPAFPPSARQQSKGLAVEAGNALALTSCKQRLFVFQVLLCLLPLLFTHPSAAQLGTDLGGQATNSAGSQQEALAVDAFKATNSWRSTPPQLDDKHKLAIGDRLSFRIAEDEDEPRPLIVSDTGDIETPYLGRIPAVNKTCRQLAGEIKAELEKEYYYEATVSLAVDLLARTHWRIYLVGAVRMPGFQDVPSDEALTLSKAIVRSGGFTALADQGKVKITRKTGPGNADKKTFEVDVRAILEKGKVENDVPLEPGDMILVPERSVFF